MPYIVSTFVNVQSQYILILYYIGDGKSHISSLLKYRHSSELDLDIQLNLLQLGLSLTHKRHG